MLEGIPNSVYGSFTLFFTLPKYYVDLGPNPISKKEIPMEILNKVKGCTPTEVGVSDLF